MMTASMLRRKIRTRIKTWLQSADISYQLYFIETCICQLTERICQIAFLKHISPTTYVCMYFISIGQ